MKKLIPLMAFALAASVSVAARDLVITLADGSRQAFHLSSSEHVVMLQTDDGFTLNGIAYKTEDVTELRIFKEKPEDAIVITGIEAPAAKPAAAPAVYDLSGRRVADTLTDGLHPGIYIINNHKVIIP